MPLTKIQSLGITDGTIVNADINASAAIASTKLSGSFGKVLQVVQSIGTGATFSTTSTSFVATGTNVSITPSSASSKVFVMVTSGLFWVNENSATASGGGMTIYRNSTNINPSGGGHMARNYRIGATNIQSGGMAMSVLDSPNTTSSTTYTVRIISIWNNPTIQWNSAGDDVAVITAFEIGA
jgi:hypothetical protein